MRVTTVDSVIESAIAVMPRRADSDVTMSAPPGGQPSAAKQLEFVYTCRCGHEGVAGVVADQCGPGQHASDVTCDGCGAVEQVVWRSAMEG